MKPGIEARNRTRFGGQHSSEARAQVQVAMEHGATARLVAESRRTPALGRNVVLAFPGAGPPLGTFSFHQRGLQNVTLCPSEAFPSEMTKLPPTDVPKTTTPQEDVSVDPPTSSIFVVIVNEPVEA